MGQTAGQLLNEKVWDLKEIAPFLELLGTPAWLYDCKSGRNIWGNKAALGLFKMAKEEFVAPQMLTWDKQLQGLGGQNTALMASQWQATTEQLKQLAKGAPSSALLLKQPWQPQAGFLPLPQTVEQLAVATQGVKVLIKVKLVQALLIQALDVRDQSLPGPVPPNSHQLPWQSPNCEHSLVKQASFHKAPSREPSGGLYSSCSSSPNGPQAVLASTSAAAALTAGDEGTTSAEAATAAAVATRPKAVVASLAGVGGAAAAAATAAPLEVETLPLAVLGCGSPRSQEQAKRDLERRLTAMCANHAMFHFLFDQRGELLAANKRAMANMREHLGDRDSYSLPDYWGMGQCDGGLSPEQHFEEAAHALFVLKEPCYRLPQLRWSKRHPGKSRWVLHEMWPITDPITGQLAMLVTEQNISQVKSMEEKYSSHMHRLELQLEEALAAQQQDGAEQHQPLIDIETAAEKTLQLLDRMLEGLPISVEDAEDLRAAILGSNNDMAQPLFLKEQLIQSTKASGMEPEVGASLLQMLSMHVAGDEDDVASCLEAWDDSPRSTNSTSGAGSGSLLPRLDPERERVAMYTIPKPEVERLLGQIDEWQFDAFKLTEAAQNRPLSLITFFLLKRMELVKKFNIDEKRLTRWLVKIEDGYPDNPYHNRTHAADVVRMAHLLCTRGGIIYGAHADDSLLALYIAACIHDYGHRGVNNDFLVRSSDPLAIRYNDRSPQENHHLAASFTLLGADELNWLKGLSHRLREQMRKMVIDMVLATDMKQHFAIHGLFQSKVNHISGGSSSKGNTSNQNAGTSAAPLNPTASNLARASSGGPGDSGASQQLPHHYHSPGGSGALPAIPQGAPGPSGAAAFSGSHHHSLPLQSGPPMGPFHAAAAAGGGRGGAFGGAPHVPPHLQHLNLHHNQQQLNCRSSSGLLLPPVLREGRGGTRSSLDLSGPLPLQIQGSFLSATSGGSGLSYGSGPVGSSFIGLASLPSGGSREGSNTGLPCVNAGGQSFMKSIRHTVSVRRAVQDEDPETISLYLQVALKCADLGHLTCMRAVHCRWVACLEEELFLQGDKEKDAGLSVSPLMDRNKAGVTKSQVGFFDIVALPLFQTFVQKFPGAEPLLEGLRENYQLWKVEAALESQMTGLGGSNA